MALSSYQQQLANAHLTSSRICATLNDNAAYGNVAWRNNAAHIRVTQRVTHERVSYRANIVTAPCISTANQHKRSDQTLLFLRLNNITRHRAPASYQHGAASSAVAYHQSSFCNNANISCAHQHRGINLQRYQHRQRRGGVARNAASTHITLSRISPPPPRAAAPYHRAAPRALSITKINVYRRGIGSPYASTYESTSVYQSAQHQLAKHDSA